MQQLIDVVSLVYREKYGKDPVQVDVLPQSGSDRRYFRLFDEGGQSVIGTYGLNVQENETFIYFSDHFKQKDLNIPGILAVSEDKTIYLQEDLGSISLLNILEKK